MPDPVRTSLVTLAVILGVMLAVLAAMAIVMELSGLGGNTPEPLAVVALAVGFVTSLGLPALLARWLFPEHAGRVFIGVLACGLLAVVAVLGLLWLI